MPIYQGQQVIAMFSDINSIAVSARDLITIVNWSMPIYQGLQISAKMTNSIAVSANDLITMVLWSMPIYQGPLVIATIT